MHSVTHALDMQRSRASAVARELRSRSPQDSTLSIFAGGSLGRGEVWAADVAGQIEIYSDVDIYAVVRDAARLGAVRAAARAAAAVPADTERARFLRPPDIGVYTLEDLAAQPARPGTIGLVASHLLLDGDPAVPRGLPAHTPSEIAHHEALYLVENRIAELLEPPAVPGTPGARAALVRALKAHDDVHAAHLIVAGTFEPGLSARAKRVGTVPRTVDADARNEITRAYRAAADLGAWLQTADAGAETDRSLRALTRAWRTLAPIVLETGTAERPELLVPVRCRAGARRDNARDAVRMRRAFGVPLWRAMVAAPTLSRLSPHAVLRVDALVRRLRAEGFVDPRRCAAHEAYLDRLTRSFGFRTGPVEARVRAMRRVIS